MNPNQTLFFSHTQFLLLGFPGISKARPLVVIPFLSVYVVILTGNSLVIHQIRVEKSLQSPMYYLISLLFAVNITSTSVVLPKLLLGLAFNLNEVTLHGCLAQMFCIYFLAIFESSVVLLMALDRYVAICRPLHYHHIVTKPFLVRLVLIGLLRGGVLVSPLVILASRVHFCGSNVILNFACENMALLSLACGDVSTSQVAGMAVRVLVTVVDVAFLLISYSGILYTAMNIAAGKARHKALHTCGTHLSVAVSIYLSALLASVVYRMETVSYDVQNLFSAVYLLVPATLNPFIYGLRVKEIRESLARSWRNRNEPLATPAHRRVNRTFVLRLAQNKDGER